MQKQTKPEPSGAPMAKMILAVAIIVSLGAALGVAGYLAKNKPVKIRQPQVLPAAEQEAANQVIDKTADWKTYRNEEYGFEVKYYPELNFQEHNGNGTDDGQFDYLFLINVGVNPSRNQYGYELRLNKQRSLDRYREELIGHVTDKIDSEEKTLINGNAWIKINYQIFLAADSVSFTTAFTNYAGYSYAITSSASDIDQILSTFKFIN
ncbi:hypothetical protein KKB43_06050 [Patescibacteria group bacterium]|nr:hypothetical protein [Patescibacteria group bacterium]MBU4580543.1 hypothetical protein [Patescibacteria group bacterium]